MAPLAARSGLATRTPPLGGLSICTSTSVRNACPPCPRFSFRHQHLAIAVLSPVDLPLLLPPLSKGRASLLRSIDRAKFPRAYTNCRVRQRRRSYTPSLSLKPFFEGKPSQEYSATVYDRVLGQVASPERSRSAPLYNLDWPILTQLISARREGEEIVRYTATQASHARTGFLRASTTRKRLSSLACFPKRLTAKSFLETIGNFARERCAASGQNYDGGFAEMILRIKRS